MLCFVRLGGNIGWGREGAARQNRQRDDEDDGECLQIFPLFLTSLRLNRALNSVCQALEPLLTNVTVARVMGILNSIKESNSPYLQSDRHHRYVICERRVLQAECSARIGQPRQLLPTQKLCQS